MNKYVSKHDRHSEYEDGFGAYIASLENGSNGRNSALKGLDEAIEILRKFSDSCVERACTAHKQGRTEFERDLLIQSVEIDCFIDDLDFLSLIVESNIATAETFDALSELPDMIKNLSISGKKININKIGKKMGDLLKTFEKNKKQISDLHKRLRPNYDWEGKYQTYHGRPSEKETNRLNELLNKKKQLVERKIIAGNPLVQDEVVAPAPQPKPNTDGDGGGGSWFTE